MGAVTRLLPRRCMSSRVIADGFGMAVSAVLAWASWSFVADSREFGDTLLDGVPAWWLQSIMPVAFALMALQFLLHAVKRLRGTAAEPQP